MRPLGEQFLGARRALDILAGEAADETEGQVLQEAEAGAHGREIAHPRLFERPARRADIVAGKARLGAADAHALDPERGLQAGRGRQGQFVEQEGRGGAGIGRGEQAAGLARRAESGSTELHAEHRAEGAERGRDGLELGFDPAFDLALAEGRGGFEAAVMEMILVVPVERAADPEAQCCDDRAVEAEFALGGDARLDQVDARAMRGRLDAGQAVEAAHLRDRGADIAVLEKIGGAERAAERIGEAVGLAAARHRVVAGIAAVDIRRIGPVAGAPTDLRGAVEAVVARAEAAAHHAGHALRTEPGRDALVADIDDAADRRRAEAQRRRPADHLDALGRQGIDRHRVILGEIGNVMRADAVFLDAHAGIVEAADDRPADGARREAAAGNARQGEQLIAERRAAVALDLALIDHGDRHEGAIDHRELAFGEAARVGGRRPARRLDEDFGQCDLARRALGGSRCGEGGQREHGNSEAAERRGPGSRQRGHVWLLPAATHGHESYVITLHTMRPELSSGEVRRDTDLWWLPGAIRR